MIASFKKQFVACGLSLLLAVTMTSEVGAQEQQAAPTDSSGYTGQGASLSTQELDSLVAPTRVMSNSLPLSSLRHPRELADRSPQPLLAKVEPERSP